MPKLFKPEKINIKTDPSINESWIQDQIASDPKILGIGDVVLKDKERILPKGGRLDILLQEVESNRRYEVEIQLGNTDESHIIRTIEYWDLERKRYPQYDHCAVIIAEDITSRFLNVISLFNGHIPLIAIQMNAYKMGEDIALIFTKVLDELPLGLVDDDEEVNEVTDRNYWLNRSTEAVVKLADEMCEIISEFATGIELKYNKFYVGLSKDGQPFNFVVFHPRKKELNTEFKLEQSDEVQKIIEDENLDDLGYSVRNGRFRLRISKQDIKNKKEILKDLLKRSYENFK